MYKVNLIGKKFGKLLVISFDTTIKVKNDYKRYWNCICDCGMSCSKLQKLLIKGSTKSCGCNRVENGKKRFKGFGELSKSHWNQIIRHANSRNIKVEVKIEDAWNLFIKQNRKCALTGIILFFSKSRKDEECGNTTASLDRIDRDRKSVV